MKALPHLSGSYTPTTGKNDVFYYEFVKDYDYFVIKWGTNQTAVLKEGTSMDIKNKATGSGLPTTISVDRGKLYVWE